MMFPLLQVGAKERAHVIPSAYVIPAEAGRGNP